MNKMLTLRVLCTPRLAFTAISALLASVVSASGQRVFNGEHTVSLIEEDWRPDRLLIGFGEGQDGTLNFEEAWVQRVAADSRLADSDGTGTHNTAILNLDSDSFSSFGREPGGEGLVTVEGENSELMLPRLFLGSDSDLDPSGVATLQINDGAILRIGGHLGVSNGSVIEIDGENGGAFYRARADVDEGLLP